MDENINNKKVADAIKMAQLDEFIQSLPLGLTLLLVNGVNFRWNNKNILERYMIIQIFLYLMGNSALDHQTEEDHEGCLTT